MKKFLIIFVLLASGAAGFFLSWYQYSAKVALDEAPVIETFHYPDLFVKQLINDPKAGEKIFKEFCATCHAEKPIIPDVNAPRIHDKKAWQPRKKLGKDLLLKITIEGVGAMPARGGCFECSDAQLREVISYMLRNS